ATLVGTLVYGFGGWPWSALLLAFFISSSLLTFTFKSRKQTVQDDFSKGSARDAAQVFANGGLPVVFALLHALFPAQPWTWAGFAGALAAVNSDTWATELGVLNSASPRLITNPWKRVQAGTSGGISLLG